MAYERLNLKTDDLLDEAVFKKIDDAIEAMDSVLDAKIVEVEKFHRSTNRFDKNAIEFVNGWYVRNTLPKDGTFVHTLGSGVSGWLYIPVETGKTYTMSVTPITLSDLNMVYGLFTNLWFVDKDNKIVTLVPFSGSTDNYYNYGTSGGVDYTTVAYSDAKVTCRAYGDGNNSARGMGTSAVTFTVKDSNIAYVHVQIGTNSGNAFQINANFTNRGFFSESEILHFQNSLQINEGEELLEYEVGGDYEYTAIETQHNLAGIVNAFEEKIIYSTNLLNPSYTINHQFIRNNALTADNKPLFSNSNTAALLQIPVTVGEYALHSELVEIGNKTFGYFGWPIFTDEEQTYITSNYKYSSASGVPVGYDTTKVSVTGECTNTIRFTILDENIKYMFVALMDSDKNTYGIWQNYSPSTGLTDEELFNLVYHMQMNVGSDVLEWQAYDEVKKLTLLSTENINGFEEFKDDIESKINDTIQNVDFTGAKNMLCVINDNDMYIRAKQFTSSNDLVWHVRKERLKSNCFFNLETLNTCPKNTSDENTMSSLSRWKDCNDDVCPIQVNGTYIAGNHGYLCVDKITATAHGKTDVDIGSVWTDASGKTYVLVFIYDADTLGFIMFDDNSMSTGIMALGSPAVDSEITHVSGATNTNTVVVEAVTSAQMWKCQNHYNLKLFVDGIEQDFSTNGILTGNRIEFVTEYNVIYIPAMLNYLMDNVGRNTSTSQNSDEISDYYLKMAISYQFNRNGSLSQYSSFFINKNLTLHYIGLLQSIAIGKNPYTYVPDTTTYENLTLHDGSVTQRFSKDMWVSEDKAPYRYYQFTDQTADKGICLVYDRSIGMGQNEKRITQLKDAGMYYTSTKMYPSFISGGNLTPNTFFDGMAARVPLYKYDPDLTSVGWYWCSDDIILMIDTHNTVNKDIVLPDYMNNMRVEKLDVTDSVTMEQTYIFNNKLRFQCTDYGYAVLRLYK